MRPISDVEWYRSRYASQAVAAVEHATSAILFPSREVFPLAQARHAPTTTQQQPLVVAREAKVTILVVKEAVDKVITQEAKATADRATTQGIKEMVDRDIILGVRETAAKDTTQEDKVKVDKAITQVDRVMVDKDITLGVREVVDRAITREDKEMADKASTQEEEADRGISQVVGDRVTTLEARALGARGITRG